jgi:PAS domain S-box-containing protein
VRALNEETTSPTASKPDLDFQNRLLSFIQNAQSLYIQGMPVGDVFDSLLNGLLELTESEYGFIAEVLFADGQRPCLKCHAITNAAGSEETRTSYDANAAQGPEFYDLDTLPGRVLVTGKAVISNDPQHDTRASEIVDGHPPFSNFLGIPFYYSDKLFGMVAIANRPQGYDQTLIDALEPMLDICAHVIESTRINALRCSAEQRLAAKSDELQTILDTVADTILVVNDELRVESINRSGVELFGYDKQALVGLSLFDLLSSESSSTGNSFIALTRGGRAVPIEMLIKDAQLGDRGISVVSIRDITDRKRAERAKDEFVSTVSHELRTPMTAIIGSLGLLDSGVIDPHSTGGRELVSTALRNSDRLLLLINDILDIQKIESGKLELHIGVCDVKSLTESVVQAVDSYMKKFNVSARVAYSVGENRKITADENRAHQVLLNLLSNAAKFSPDGATILLTIGEDDEFVRFEVADKGVGIPAEFQDRIFSKFSQASNAHDKHISGTGLGLSISKTLVEKMGGEIGFESREGLGSRFYFTLPKRAPMLEP